MIFSYPDSCDDRDNINRTDELTDWKPFLFDIIDDLWESTNMFKDED